MEISGFSIQQNRFLGSFKVYKFGLWTKYRNRRIEEGRALTSTPSLEREKKIMTNEDALSFPFSLRLHYDLLENHSASKQNLNNKVIFLSKIAC